MDLNFKEYGQGEPLIILHGLFGTLDNWQTIAKQLAEDYTVIAVDQRNHGRSPHVPELTYSLMAEDLQRFMEQQWVHRAHILGHSMGGKTAMQFAMDYPDMVDKLIIVDIAPGANAGGHELIFEALLGLDLATVTDRKTADKILEVKIKDFGVRQFLLKNLTRQKSGGFRWKMNLPVIHKHYPDILAGIKGEEVYDGETLFIRGGKSGYIEEQQEKEIKEHFPHSSLVTVENAGHWVHAEAPAQLLQLVQGFLK